MQADLYTTSDDEEREASRDDTKAVYLLYFSIYSISSRRASRLPTLLLPAPQLN